MSEPGLQTSVGEWVAQRPSTSRVFESLQIDYCCGGSVPLSQACAARQLDPQVVLERLRETARDPVMDAERWAEAPLAALCDHIEQTHHAYLRTELPRLQALVTRTLQAHGTSHPELLEVRNAFADLVAELTPHMHKEEQVLFPAIRQLELDGDPVRFPFGSVANPIRMMEHEHDLAGLALGRIRRATGDYLVPEDACPTYRAMLDALQQLERDMHQHVHKENNILFPRAREAERLGSSG